MALGYDVYEDDRDFEQEGITGEVKKFVKGTMQYPCLILEETAEKRLNLFSLQTAQEMFTKPEGLYDESDIDRIVFVYIRLLDGHLISFNSIDSMKVNAFCKLFEGYNITGRMYVDGEIEELDSDLISVLATY